MAHSESNNYIGGPADAPEGGGSAIRNPGWKTGIRIGSAKDGSLTYFIEGTRPEGLAADELGNIFWAKAESLGALVFIHPQGVPQLSARLEGNGFLTNVIGNPLETTIALSHLIFEGTLDRFPGLRICGAHGGGFLPSYNGRFDQGCVAFPANCTKTLKKRPSEYLKQLYFDSMVFSSEGLRHLVAEYGASQIVMGTDYPFPWTTRAVDHVLSTPGLTDADRTAILGGNLARLLGIDQKSG